MADCAWTGSAKHTATIAAKIVRIGFSRSAEPTSIGVYNRLHADCTPAWNSNSTLSPPRKRRDFLFGYLTISTPRVTDESRRGDALTRNCIQSLLVPYFFVLMVYLERRCRPPSMAVERLAKARVLGVILAAK